MSQQQQPTPPPAPNQKQSYLTGVNTYLSTLPRFLQAEMTNRYGYDPQRIAEQQGLQQQIQNAMNFQNSATPEAWIQGIAPIQADRSMAYVNPNAGFQGQQFALQTYQNQLVQQGLGLQGVSPWVTAGSVIGGTVGSIY